MKQTLSTLLVLVVAGVAAGCWHGGVEEILPTAATVPAHAAGPSARAAVRPAWPAVRSARTRSYPSDLLVYAQEWSLWPSRTTIPAGTIDVELWNRGEDAHDVEVRRLRGATMVGPVLGRVAPTASGAISHGVWHLKAGRYELFCSMPGHIAMGMHSDVTVTSPRS